jgi:hypothetical protein
MAVQSAAEEHTSECIESPVKIGASAKVLPPSLVETKVASMGMLGGRPFQVVVATRPPQKAAVGHDRA